MRLDGSVGPSRWHEAGVAALLLVCYAYTFPRWADWNQNSRFDLTVAIVDHGTLAIDCCVGNTGDYARFDGHAYTDKAPGLSFLAVPAYALFRAAAAFGPVDRALTALAGGAALAETLRADGMGLSADRLRFALGLTAAAFCTVVLPSALLGAVLFRFVARRGVRAPAALAATLAYALGSIAFPYAGSFYAHQLVAALLFGAFALVAGPLAALRRPVRLALVGLLLGYAVISEYPAVLIALLLTLYAGARLGADRRLAWITVGAAGPLALAAAYDVAAFGTPLPVGYRYSVLWQAQHQSGFFSLTGPSGVALWGITFSSFRGLFLLSPVLLLALPGFVVLLRQRAERGAAMVSALAVAAFLLFNGSSVMWWGGFAVGPRYLVPMLPFLTWPMAVFLDRGGRARWALFAALAIGSAAAVWGLSWAGQQFPADSWRFPWRDYAWPRLLAGDLARNAGMLLGLHGWSSLLPLAAAVVVIATLWWGLVRLAAGR